MTMTTTEEPPKKQHSGHGRVPAVTGYDGYLNRSVRLQKDLSERLIRAARKANVTPSSLIRAILSSSLPDLPDLVDGDQ